MRARWVSLGSCRRALKELQRYLDGESNADGAWRVARHLARCEDCFGDAEAIRSIKDGLARLRVAPDGDVLARLRGLVAALTDPSAGA